MKIPANQKYQAKHETRNSDSPEVGDVVMFNEGSGDLHILTRVFWDIKIPQPQSGLFRDLIHSKHFDQMDGSLKASYLNESLHNFAYPSYWMTNPPSHLKLMVEAEDANGQNRLLSSDEVLLVLPTEVMSDKAVLD